MESKKCSVCNEEKQLSEFYSRSSRNHKPYDRCKKCFNKYVSDRWITKKIEAIIYKGSECIDCKISYPTEPYVIFDFHHRDPSNKDFDWSVLKLRTEKKIKEELDKCDLLCSNCHRKRHHTNNL
jgi:hypothetical protein